MILQMVGIDYEKADLDTRELFSFQQNASQEGMQYLKKTYGLQGIVLLSTCNRTELYISTEKRRTDLFAMVCSLKHVPESQYRAYQVERVGEDAVHHLFELACGMRSKVFGEDQIITQVKQALIQAREVSVTDYYLENVFQSAITAAKKIKAKVHLTAVNTSVIQQMKQVLYKEKQTWNGVSCMVIGNGEIGRMAATAMVEEGAEVTVTVRNYKTRQVEIPKGCRVIDYKERYDKIPQTELIISATTSPHHTVKYEDCKELFRDGKKRILIDLAVPRDISSAFSKENQVRLYNIDSLGGVSHTKQDDAAMATARKIMQEYEEKLFEKTERQEYVPVIREIGFESGEMSYKRIKKPLSEILDESQYANVENLVRQGTQKTITALLFEMQKQLPAEQWDVCLQIIKNAIEGQLY